MRWPLKPSSSNGIAERAFSPDVAVPPRLELLTSFALVGHIDQIDHDLVDHFDPNLPL